MAKLEDAPEPPFSRESVKRLLVEEPWKSKVSLIRSSRSEAEALSFYNEIAPVLREKSGFKALVGSSVYVLPFSFMARRIGEVTDKLPTFVRVHISGVDGTGEIHEETVAVEYHQLVPVSLMDEVLDHVGL